MVHFGAFYEYDLKRPHFDTTQTKKNNIKRVYTKNVSSIYIPLIKLLGS